MKKGQSKEQPGLAEGKLLHVYNEERRKHCALAVVRRSQKKIRPAADPLPGGARRPKFNQLEMISYRPSVVKIDARNFELL